MAFTPKELTWLSVGKETNWGVAASPTYYVPFKDAKPEDKIDYIKDQGIRGALASTYNVIDGVHTGNFEITGETFPDSIGLFLLSALGLDTVTGSASPYTHAFKLNRTGQPPSLTTSYYDGTSMRQFAGQICEELSFKWADNAALEYTYKTTGKASAVATTATPTLTGTVPFAGWFFTATLGGTANLNLVGFDISLKRKIYVQHSANNSNQPTSVTALPLEVTGKATFDKADDTELNIFLNNTQPSFVIGGTNAAGFGMTFTMSKCAFLKDTITGKEVVQGEVEYEGLDNATDSGPIQIKLINAVASY